MTEPDDRELEQYLKGGSKLSQRYREAGGETAPPELDEVILARARAEARRKPPSLNRYLAPVALAASVVLGVNLAWNLRQVEPMPSVPMEAPAEAPSLAKSAEPAFVPEPPAAAAPARQAPAEARARTPAPAEDELEAVQATDSVAREESEAKKAEQRAVFAEQIEAQRRAMKEKDEAGIAAPVVDSAPAAASARAPAAALADTAALTEAQKIDRLIGYVAALEGATFIRNGEQHTPAEAAKHLQLKREKAGSRVKTADDFIRLCASYSSMSGEAYLIKFADGRTRTAEDVLREELARLNAGD